MDGSANCHPVSPSQSKAKRRAAMNRKIWALIVDDEPLAHKALRSMLKDDPEMEVIVGCLDGNEAVQIIREQSPDVVFLDIQMPEMDGFQVIEEVGVKLMPVTVFVTAFDKHALRAFEAHAIDYLLKPFDHDRFNTALQRAKTQVRQRKLGEINESLFAVLKDLKPESNELDLKTEKVLHKEAIDRVAIKASGRVYFLKVEEIDWVESAGDYLSLHAASKTHLIRETMENFHAKLNPQKFLRIHRSFVVNIERIKDIQPFFKGDYVITLVSGKRLKSSRSYRHEIQALLDEAR
jgi:two-component system LytT family response regulator